MARTKGGLAVFVKTPELSPVKTRLAADIGAPAAKKIHAKMLEITAAMMRKVQAGGIEVYWAVGEEAGVTHPRWQEFPAIYTGDGKLGERLHHIYQTMRKRHGCALLAGADCPQLSADLIFRAVQLADATVTETVNETAKNSSTKTLLSTESEAPIVVGPAADGGFYLFASRRDIEATVWHNVTYSQSDTLQNLLNNLNAADSAKRLPILQDVDDKESMHKSNLLID